MTKRYIQRLIPCPAWSNLILKPTWNQRGIQCQSSVYLFIVIINSLSSMSDSKQTVSELSTLTEDELKFKKLVLEVSMLQNQLDGFTPPRLNILQRLYKYLQKNVGQIVAIALLLSSFVTPVWKFVSSQRQQQMITVNNSILQIMDTTKITKKQLMEVSAQDPKIVAPILLDQFNKRNIDPDRAIQIYKWMYDVNKDLVHESLFDHVFFFFADDNKDVLEDELCSNAIKQFQKDYDRRDLKVTLGYIDMIFDFGLHEKKDFKNALNVLLAKCASKESKHQHLCDYLTSKISVSNP
jgi:hypothetical protein